MATLTLLAAYDVRQDDRRAHLAALLQTVGDRVQKSVFIVMVDADEFAELSARTLAAIDPDTDSLMFFRQCGTCWDAHTALGQGQLPDPVTHWAVF